MDLGKTIHLFSTSKCNEKCKFCFRPYFDDKSRFPAVIETLSKNKIKNIVITGGEPLLIKNLEQYLGVLKDSGVDISVHTNGLLLSPERINSLCNIVDEITLPLDSVKRQTQEYLRGADCLEPVKKALKHLQNKNVRIGIHTVATSENLKDIPRIYQFLNRGRFDYWRIYEFNSDLVEGKFKNPKRFMEIQSLRDDFCAEDDGGVNSYLADFLLMEERMQKKKDERIKFVGIRDYDREPYLFIGPQGDAFIAFWFSQGKRKKIGNLLEDGYKKVIKNANKADNEGVLFDESSFINTLNDLPLWARAAWEGNYFYEELDEVHSSHHKKFVHLSRLYLERLIRQGAAPKDAEFTYDYFL